MKTDYSLGSGVPDRENFLSLLKSAWADRTPFEYKCIPWGKSLYIAPDTVEVMIDVLETLDDDNREILLAMVPQNLTLLTMRCWEIKTNPLPNVNIPRYTEPKERFYYQYEFDFMRKDNEPKPKHDPADEGRPFCGHKAHRPTA